ncbi:response regulator transcription factor [Virgibacillus sp. NKC19-3]|uniref:helix-turn-helix transcriptional regulator n=1 Tax=Virgibacillus saliphilus TaxID=2831674 RepID=UPI001C9B1239|nr:LuxR C-terminal-related transcriptional regulator [Virgibacillus sp. NKC19-3]MBY7142012.1 response regulator transcription factor [Virgibacillus sp. NKC19-3]
MNSLYILQDQVRKLETIVAHEEKFYGVLEVYLNYFPVCNAFLSRFSPLGYVGEGIISLSSSGLENISDIRDDVRSLPVFYSSIQERQAKYCTGVEYFKQLNSKYNSHFNSVVVVPICLGSVAIGFICSTVFKEGANVDKDMLSAFTHYGKLIGDLFEKSDSLSTSKLLSKRELEVMRNISWGESTKEMAAQMNISEYTVKQYVKSAKKKLGAENRSHAVGVLIRQGVIT